MKILSPDIVACARHPGAVILVFLLALSSACYSDNDAANLHVSSSVKAVDVIKALDRDTVRILALGNRPNADGAIGRNRQGYIAVALQRAALTLIISGLVNNDDQEIRLGLQALEHGFSYQTEDGGFQAGSFGSKSLSEGDLASSAAFFMSAVALASHFIKSTEHADRYRNALDSLQRKSRHAMSWLLANYDVLWQYDRDAPNRLIFDALAFMLNGQILDDEKLRETGALLLDSALSMQRDDGVFVEKGGHDSSYQATSLLLLQYYWLFAGDTTDKQRVFNAIAEGIEWEKQRIEPDGEVSAQGNTRTGLGQEVFLGKVKQINYHEVAQAFLYWSIIGEDKESGELASHVLRHANKGRSADQQLREALVKQRLAEKKDLLVQLGKQAKLPGKVKAQAESLYNQARVAYEKQQFGDAESLLDRAIEMLRRHANKGRSADQQLREALVKQRLAEKKDLLVQLGKQGKLPGKVKAQAESLYNQARVAYEKQQFGDAESLLDRAIEMLRRSE